MATYSSTATGTFHTAFSGSPTEELLSVVVPCFNVHAKVEKCISSLLAQTYRNMEIIAVNDRSTDDTGTILDRMAKQDPRLRVIHAQENGGPHAARLLGVQFSRGGMIGFVDSDDHVRPDMFAGLAKALQTEGADIAICNFVLVDQAGNERPHIISSVRRIVDDDILDRFSRFEFGSGMLWNKLFRKPVLQPHISHSLDRTVDFGEDSIVTIGCFAMAKRVVLVPEPFYHYLQYPESGSHSSDNPKAFSLLLNSYVKCLEVYEGQGERVASAIDALYRHQLRFSRYKLVDSAALTPYLDRLSRTIAKLAQLRPQSIYSLVHAFDGEEGSDPSMPPRFHLGQVRISLSKAIKAFVKGRA